MYNSRTSSHFARLNVLFLNFFLIIIIGNLWGEEDSASTANVKQPVWASDFGNDEFGLYAVINIGSEFQKMRYIRSGSYVMGSSETEDVLDWHDKQNTKQRKVVLTKNFWLGDCEVTQECWSGLMGNNPSKFKGKNNLPVHNISWNDSQDFLKKLNAIIPGLQARLPTEAQWEYACRSGTIASFFGKLDNVGWYAINSGGIPHAVKSKRSNNWGLYDMHGNVCEWCLDTDSGIIDKQVVDQIDPMGDGENFNNIRVFRGGSWLSSQNECRSSFRDAQTINVPLVSLGLRICVME